MEGAYHVHTRTTRTGGRWPMALSDEEQRLLEQMEAALAAEDPKLVNTLRGTCSASSPPSCRTRWSRFFHRLGPAYRGYLHPTFLERSWLRDHGYRCCDSDLLLAACWQWP